MSAALLLRTDLLNIGSSNAGLQSGLFVYPDEDLVIVVLSNTWGIGSNSGEMNGVLLSRLAAICMGWPQPRRLTELGNYGVKRRPAQYSSAPYRR